MSLKQLAFNYLPDRLLKTARHLHYRGSLRHYDVNSEPDLLGCRHVLKPGETVLDVGANIGVYTRFCSEFVGSRGKVIALEPVPETFSYLSGNVRALGLKNVTCLNYAASDHNSESEFMFIPEYSTGGANLYEAMLSARGDVQVRTAKLDTLFSELSPHFIKCDVEGHEFACITGALELIRRCRPKWMIEVSKISRNATFELFHSLDYTAFYYSDGKFCEYGPGYPRSNFFFFPN